MMIQQSVRWVNNVDQYSDTYYQSVLKTGFEKESGLNQISTAFAKTVNIELRCVQFPP